MLVYNKIAGNPNEIKENTTVRTVWGQSLLVITKTKGNFL